MLVLGVTLAAVDGVSGASHALLQSLRMGVDGINGVSCSKAIVRASWERVRRLAQVTLAVTGRVLFIHFRDPLTKQKGQ